MSKEPVTWTSDQRAQAEAIFAKQRDEARAKARPELKVVPPEHDHNALSPEPASAVVRKSRSEGRVFDPHDPLVAARGFIDECFIDAQQNFLLRRHRGVFYLYNGSFYDRISDDEVRTKVWEFFGRAFQPAKGGVKPFRPTAARVSDVINALTAVCALDARTNIPAWIGGDHNYPPANELVSVQNGLLHLASGTLHEPTPRFFGTSASDVKFVPGAEAPGWLAFLREVWSGDPDHIRTLQEWFGYCLSADTRQQKILFLYGPSRAGKGTIVRVLKALIGPRNVASPTLANLSSNFGLAPLIGKPLAVIPDARLSGRSDQAVVVERLLSISGEDLLDIDRKHREAWTGALPTRIMIVTNELLGARDASSALIKRFLVLKLSQSFYGKEDSGLTDRLLTELPGILNWSVEGYCRLVARGHFIQPATAEGVIDDLEGLASPIIAFAREKCDLGPDRQISAAMLFEHWRLWCEANGHQPGTAQTFGRNLAAACPEIVVRRPRQGGENRPRIYEGITMRRSGTTKTEGGYG